MSDKMIDIPMKIEAIRLDATGGVALSGENARNIFEASKKLS